MTSERRGFQKCIMSILEDPEACEEPLPAKLLPYGAKSEKEAHPRWDWYNFEGCPHKYTCPHDICMDHSDLRMLLCLKCRYDNFYYLFTKPETTKATRCFYKCPHGRFIDPLFSHQCGCPSHHKLPSMALPDIRISNEFPPQEYVPTEENILPRKACGCDVYQFNPATSPGRFKPKCNHGYTCPHNTCMDYEEQKTLLCTICRVFKFFCTIPDNTAPVGEHKIKCCVPQLACHYYCKHGHLVIHTLPPGQICECPEGTKVLTPLDCDPPHMYVKDYYGHLPTCQCIQCLIQLDYITERLKIHPSYQHILQALSKSKPD